MPLCHVLTVLRNKLGSALVVTEPRQLLLQSGESVNLELELKSFRLLVRVNDWCQVLNGTTDKQGHSEER